MTSDEVKSNETTKRVGRKTKRGRALFFDFDTTEKFKKYKYQKKNLAQEMWEKEMNSTDSLPQQALKTKFIQGIKYGNLDPNDYGKFMVQDASYLIHGTQIWKRAVDSITEQINTDIEEKNKLDKKTESDKIETLVEKISQLRELRKFTKKRMNTYELYSENFSSEWGLTKIGIELNIAASAYIYRERIAFEKLGYWYISVIMYACYKLYPYLANTLSSDDKTVKEGNIYYSWIEGNVDEEYSSAARLENAINKSHDAGYIDEKIAQNLLHVFLGCEVNMFKAPCGELDLNDKV